MKHRISPLVILICLLLIAGCSKVDKETKESSDSSSLTRSLPAPVASREESGAGVLEPKRYIAMRHSVLVETSETELPTAWEAVTQFCQTIRCEIVASSIRQQSYNSPPNASLTLRVAPEDTQRLFEQLGKVGRIVEHRTESEDKTSAVIDADARIKNLTELRDRLRQMLGTPNAGLKDVVEVERELSKTQSDLESFQMRRKVLAAETEKVFVDIAFHSKKSVAETGAFAPITTACQEAGHVLAASIAFAITFVVAVVPWLILLIPSLWILTKAFKRLRGKKVSTNKSQH